MKNICILFISILPFCSCVTERSTVTGWAYNDPAPGGFEPRKVIYTSTVELLVDEPDSVSRHLARIAAKYNGYVLTAGSHKTVMRVKENLLSKTIEEICQEGKLKDKAINGKDVSEEYHDSKIRLENCEKARLRYLELLAKAENVEAALKVEKELERLNGEIDSLKGRITVLEHLSVYATISVHLHEKIKPGILGYAGIGLYRGVKWLFVRG